METAMSFEKGELSTEQFKQLKYIMTEAETETIKRLGFEEIFDQKPMKLVACERCGD